MKSHKTKGFRSASSSPFGGATFGSQASGSSLSYLAKPPDFNTISDANLVVWFKNLLKKDSTTKAKALEELVAYAAAHPFEKDGGVEEAVLDVWIELYPRISIDSSRRVRELSHSFQFELMKSARKRMERHIPKVVGSWLTGLYDKDRVVSRAASDGLSSFLNSPEKAGQFWKKCQPHVLDFAISAIQETKETLSDERTTTAEDADSKYFRVVNAALCILCSLLSKVNDQDRAKLEDRYDSFFDEETVWKSVTFQDTQVRKSACQLMLICLDKRRSSLEMHISRVKREFVIGGLKDSQMNTAIEFVKALTKITNAFPQIWGSKDEGAGTSSKKEKTALPFLLSFLAQGSHGCPVAYWEFVEQLLRDVPIPAKFIFDTALNMRAGVAKEYRLHSNAAWMSYLHVCRRLLHRTMDESKVQFAIKFLRPILAGWADARGDGSDSSQRLTNLVVIQECCATCMSDSMVASATEEWVNDMGISLIKRLADGPNDETLAQDGALWFSLVGQLQKSKMQPHAEAGTPSPRPIPFDTPSEKVVKACVGSCKENPEATTPARILRQALEATNYLETSQTIQNDVSSMLEDLARTKMEASVSSSTHKDILSCLQAFGRFPSLKETYDRLWEIWAKSVLGLSPSPDVTSAMTTLLSDQVGAALGKRNDAVKKYILEEGWQCITAEAETESWNGFETAVRYGIQNNELFRLALQLLPSHTHRALQALLILARHASLVSDVEILHEAQSKMLLLAESDDVSVSSTGREVLTLLDNVEGKKPVMAILQDNLEKAGPLSLGVNTLAKLAIDSQDSKSLVELLPNTALWRSELSAVLSSINPSLSITSSLGGAQCVVEGTSPGEKVPRDRKGYSIPLRMAIYVSMLLESGKDIMSLPRELSREVLLLLFASVQIVSDQLTLADRGKLFAVMTDSSQLVADRFMSSARGWLNMTVENDAGESVMDDLVDYMLSQSERTPLGFYCAQGLSELVQTLTEAHGPPVDLDELLLKASASSKTNPLPIVALLSGVGQSLGSSDRLKKMCNNLVSDIIGAKPGSEKTLPALVMATAALGCFQEGEVPIQTNRLVFAVKNVTGWFEADDELAPELAAEACRLLLKILPEISSVYGPHWELTLEYCAKLWTDAHKYPLDSILSAIHASIKLYAVLESLEEPNDDLEDALKQFAQAKATGLIQLLKLPRRHPSQPLAIVDSLICRQIQKLPLRLVKEPSDLYELMASELPDIQTAAFSILHKALPAAQQQLSVDILLDKTSAQLPGELLSLLLEHPTLEKYHEVLSQFPAPVRSYLLTWHLIFDGYSEASLNVRNDYTENLKSDNYVTPLLEFMFDVLGHTAGNALKLDKEGIHDEQIRNYDMRLAESLTPEESMHWLLVHLFYLVLKYIPELFKTWFINCRSKQTKIAIEPWLSKYFSPMIISDVLDDVAKWAEGQESPKDDEKELMVKVNRNAREVTAGYEVDEEVASIAIKVPMGYPIEGIVVEGTNRAVAAEKKWQSWVRTTQGVITFSNGSIIDGLLTFRRNIVGELKGQTECAICYSIMSTDKRMPDKRCQTCKNLFHRTCLFKWLQTSNQNSCPLCRTPIDYLGRDTRRRPQI